MLQFFFENKLFLFFFMLGQCFLASFAIAASYDMPLPTSTDYVIKNFDLSTEDRIKRAYHFSVLLPANWHTKFQGIFLQKDDGQIILTSVLNAAPSLPMVANLNYFTIRNFTKPFRSLEAEKDRQESMGYPSKIETIAGIRWIVTEFKGWIVKDGKERETWNWQGYTLVENVPFIYWACSPIEDKESAYITIAKILQSLKLYPHPELPDFPFLQK